MSAGASRLVVRPTVAACAAGALLGAIYTMSPMTVWFGLATIPIFAWAGRGLSGRERVWLFRILALALVLRVLALIAFFLSYHVDPTLPVLIPDESYIQRRALWIRNVTLGIPIMPGDYVSVFDRYGESGLLYFLANLQAWLGPAPYGVRLLSVALYLAGAVALYRAVRPAFGPAAALGGLATVLFLPSLFVWSISTLKEPAFLFFTAMSLSAAAAAVRAKNMLARVLAIITCAIGVLGVGAMRGEAQFAVGGGILAGLLLATGIRRPALLLLVLVAGVVIGYQVGSRALQDPGIQVRVRDRLDWLARRHIGHLSSGGWGYKVLDAESYAAVRSGDWSPGSMTAPAVARYGIRATASFVLAPLPWRVASPPALAYLPEQVVWWVLIALAGIGSIGGVQKDRHLTLALIGVIVVSALGVAIVSGNVGTLIRHRAIVLMLLPWLSSLGACALLTHIASRCRPREHQAMNSTVGVQA